MMLTILLMIVSILLITAILLQARGTGLGAGMGGDGAVFRTKRGIEHKLQLITIVLSILFFGIALAQALI